MPPVCAGTRWDRAGHPSQVKLARFLAHVDAIAGPVLATVSGRVAAELIVGFSDGVSLTDGGHDLDDYLFPVAQRLGPERVAAIFGRKIHGPSSLALRIHAASEPPGAPFMESAPDLGR